MAKKKRIYKEDVTWRIDPEVLKKFKIMAIEKNKSYSVYVEELMKQEIEKENENKDQD